MSDYYNTNRETGKVLRKSHSNARTQQESILAFFQANPEDLFSPEAIQAAVIPSAPITSARRAITNLTGDGWLIKTDHMTEGRWSKMVHTWKLKKQ